MTDRTLLHCGCAGKTPLERIVRPARRKVKPRLAAASVYLAGELDSGLVPLTEGLERESVVGGRDPEAGLSGRSWALSALLSTAEETRTADRFADLLAREYPTLGDGPTVLAKGHSVQLPGAERSVHVTELLRPSGPRQSGYWAGNIDLIHAFPNLEPPEQAAVATAHALNDCYAYGAVRRRSIRPIVATPAASRPDESTVSEWYRTHIPRETLLDPVVVPHGGEGWLYGAATTAATHTVPPIHGGRLRAGDQVVVHRPLGAVACYGQAVDAGNETLRREAEAYLRADHRAVGELIGEFSPTPGDAFDPDRHVKVATDVSGAGIAGVARLVRRRGLSFRVDELPFVDPEAVSRGRKRWLLPDATIGTNGPLAVAGRPAPLDRLTARFRREGIDARRLGELVDTAGPSLRGRDTVPLELYVEDPSIRRDGTRTIGGFDA